MRAAELQSFAACASALGLTPSAVSKSIAALERSIGVRLLTRSPNGVVLTDEGSRFYEHCRTIVAALEAAEREVAGTRSTPRGRLRVIAHTTPARSRILPELPRFLQAYPDLHLELSLSPGAKSLETEGIDVGVFLGNPPESRLVARRIADLRFITFASREYLEKYGVPRSPQDLATHKCVLYLRPDGLRHEVWAFEKANETCDLTVRGNHCVNDGSALLDAARAGMGIVRVISLVTELPRATDGLVPLLTDWYAEAPPLHVLRARSRNVPPKVRVFVEFVSALFADLRPGPGARTSRVWPMRRR